MTKGLTLVETLVVVLVAALMLGAVLTVSDVSSWSLQTGSSLSGIQWDARRGMNRMFEELYMAGSSTARIDNSANSINFQLPTINATTGTIYKEDGRTINWGDSATTNNQIRYLVLNGQLLRQVLGAGDRFIQWKMNYTESYTVYISCNTSAGHRYLTYNSSNNPDGWASSDGHYVYHGLGSSTRDGQWHTITRYLQEDLHDLQPDVDIATVDGFLIRGSGRVDDIELHSITCEDAEDGDTSNWEIYDASPGGAKIRNVYDADRESRVIEFSGDGTDNGYRLSNPSFASWTKDINEILANTVLANNISNITFTGYDADEDIDYTYPSTLTIDITVSKDSTRGHTLQSALSSRVTFRN